MRRPLYLHAVSLFNSLVRVQLCNYRGGLSTDESWAAFNRSPAKLTVATPPYWWPLPSLGLFSHSPFAVFVSGEVA